MFRRSSDGVRCYDDPVKAAALLALMLMLVYPACGDDASEIGRVTAALTRSDPPPELFAPDISDAERAYFSPEPLSEVTRPRIDIRSIHMLSDVTALVTMENTQFGSLIMKRSEPVMLLLRNYGSGAGWRIACVLAPNLPRSN
jgi:hypothetical protein